MINGALVRLFRPIQFALLIFFSSCARTEELDPTVEDQEITEEKQLQGILPEDMVWIPFGVYLRGSAQVDDPRLQAKDAHARGLAEEAPAHRVRVEGFWMDETEVTNAQFAQFVIATGYQTMAERPLRAEDFPGAPAEALLPGALVFRAPPEEMEPHERSHWNWWQFVQGANWRQPEGPGSTLDGKMDLPVVFVTYEDAEAYAEWAGKRLPTAAEWEWAARGGLEEKIFVWGDEFRPEGKWMANIFQGEFPHQNSAEDGFALAAPVRSFAENGYGLYEMAGNVWEIVSDWYVDKEYQAYLELEKPLDNPRGPAMEEADKVAAAVFAPKRTMKGGSFLCAPSYCNRYRPAARHYTDRLSATNHVGFRCVMDAPAPK